MKHDYEAALRAFTGEGGVLHMEDVEAIEHALRLAAKVTGELTQEMSFAAMDRVKDNETLFYEAIFKSMIAQAEREIEQ